MLEGFFDLFNSYAFGFLPGGLSVICLEYYPISTASYYKLFECFSTLLRRIVSFIKNEIIVPHFENVRSVAPYNVLWVLAWQHLQINL
jgi:hypothetical protein